MLKAFRIARIMPKMLAALMFEAQQQGILEYLKKMRIRPLAEALRSDLRGRLSF